MTDDGARGLRISYWTGLISPESPLCYNNQNYQHIRLCSICYVYNREMRSWQFAESNFGLPAEDGFPSVFWLCFFIWFFFLGLVGFYCCSLAGDWKCTIREGTRCWPDYKINVLSNYENENTWKVWIIITIII